MQLGFIGPRAREAFEGLGIAAPEPCVARHAELAGHAITVCGHDGLSVDGYSLVGPAEAGEALWTAAAGATRQAGGRPAGTLASEADRVLAGRPAGGAELTEDYNPLEAGLRDAVSFDKGCYVGQEVVARLNTYDKVSRALVGVNLPDAAPPPEAGSPLHRDGREVGRVTSSLVPPGWPHAVALAYVKRKHAAPGDRVQIDDVEASLIEPPWPTDP